jgi:hypothetical protein
MKPRWTLVVMGVAAMALVVRLLIIAHTHGGDDLRIYTYFSRLALHGLNPFAPPAHGTVASRYANSPPLEVAAFTVLLWVHDSPTTLRVCFALADVATLLLVGLAFPRSRNWRLAFLMFYAFNPLVLLAWTVYAEDKTILFLAIAGLILALERGRSWSSWLLTAFLAAFKFLGAFLVPALAWHTIRQRRNLAWPLLALVVLVGLTALLWFPDGLHAFSRRSGRLDLNPPLNASPVLLLSRLGIYSTVEPRVLTALGVLGVLTLLVSARVEIREAVILTILAGYVFLPDDAFDRLLLVTLPFLLVMAPSWRRWLVLWVSSCLAALGALVSTHGVPHWLSGLGGALRSVFGPHEGTLRHVAWMSLFLIVVLAMFALERGWLSVPSRLDRARRRRTPATADRRVG